MGIGRFISNRLHGPGRQAAALEAIREQLAQMQRLEVQNSEAFLEALRSIEKRLTDVWRIAEGIQYALTQQELQEVDEFSRANVLEFEATLRKIADRQLSFARFGDGEFRAMLNADHDLRFQDGSPGLQRDLLSVLTYERYDSERLLIGFPFVYRTPHWRKVWTDVWPRLSKILPRDIEYGAAHATRPVCFRRLGQQAVELWRRVWDDRHICVVTGEGSRFTMNPDLFSNIASVSFLHSKPRNAYDDIDRLKAAASEMECDQFLVSLGPAGTVLAAELSRADRWAIDIGHLSASYEQVFRGAVEPEHR